MINDTAATTKSLLRDPNQLTLEQVQIQATKTWHDRSATFATAAPAVGAANWTSETLGDIAGNQDQKDCFFHCNCSQMIAERILGIFTPSTVPKVKVKHTYYEWINAGSGQTELDCPTILWHAIQICAPKTVIVVDKYKNMIEADRVGGYNHNVENMLTAMEEAYQKIIENGKPHDDHFCHLFNALESSKNTEFLAHIGRVCRKWETDKHTPTTDELIRESVIVYNNFVGSGKWDKQDPNDAKFITLNTKVENILVLKRNIALANNANPTSDGKKHPRFEIEEWRKKKDGASKTVNGKTWWWCPDHKYKGEGGYDGFILLISLKRNMMNGLKSIRLKRLKMLKRTATKLIPKLLAIRINLN